MCLCLARVVPMVNTNGVLGLGIVKGFHNALFTVAPRLCISVNSFWGLLLNFSLPFNGSLETNDKFFSCFFFEFNYMLLFISFCKYNSLR